jgi:hypothetical protein
VIDVATVQGWIEKLGLEVTTENASALRVHPREEGLPPFIVQCTENWVMLSILPMFSGGFHPDDLSRRLLAANRDMRLAKFAMDRNGAVVLCAELPTESLDPSEVADAIQRMTGYARRFMTELGRHP